MRACNGIISPILETVEVTRLEPVIIEVEEDNKISSHLILFEFICHMNFTPDEVQVNGEVQETVFEHNAREEED